MYNTINRIDNLFFKDSVYYIYLMTFYHLLIVVYQLFHITNIQPKVMFVLNFESFNLNLLSPEKSIIANTIFILIIMIIDMIFLIIVMFEFSSLKLTFTKIFIIEIIIFVLAFSHPILRMIMLFLSLNTLQITIFYKIIKYIPFAKYPFILGSYIIIIKLLLIPVFKYINYIYH